MLTADEISNKEETYAILRKIYCIAIIVFNFAGSGRVAPSGNVLIRTK
jgi:hypothetical protein